jgi:RNA polymerase sigma-70 factor (sigma-E family)
MRTSTRSAPAAPSPRREPAVEERRQRLVEIYQAEREPMVRLAHLLTGSVATAEDVVQDAFLNLYDALDRVEAPGAYLRRSVVNLCHSHHRRLGVEDRWRDRQPAPPLSLAPEIDDTWSALRALPDRQREALVLRFYLDLKVDDVADLLDLPVGTVKSHIHRGLAALTDEVSR